MIVVSHRGPYRFERDDDGDLAAHAGAGGIVSALVAAARRQGRRDVDRGRDVRRRPRGRARRASPRDLDIDVRLLDLDREQHRMHYDVVANGVLWFLHHGMFDRARRPRFDLRFRDAWDAFVAVNQRFADAVAETRGRRATSCSCRTTSSTLVAGQLRAQRPDLRVVHFTHTPFAGPDDFSRAPDRRRRRRCARALASGPAGFHTKRWAEAYRQSARAALGRARHGHRAVRREPRARRRRARGGRGVARGPRGRGVTSPTRSATGSSIVRTDRIEPSKNIVRGFLAFDRLLEARPGLRGRVVFVAMVYPSRQGLAEYLAYENEVEQVVARVNDRWATRDWMPILLDDRDDFARSVAGMQRYDVLLVNPMRDGLNLVAKEGPVVNRRDGVLCLSPETGAYDELKPAAIAVHPYDIEQCAGALDDALVDAARRAGGARRRSCARSRRCASPADWLADLRRPRGSSSASKPGRAVDEQVDRGRELGRRLGRVHADAHRALQPAVADGARQRGERGQVAVVVARERGDVEAVDRAPRVATALSMSIGGRSSIAMRVRSSREPVLGADLARDRDDVVGLLGSGPPVQRHADPRLRFDELGRAAAPRARRSRPRPRRDTARRAGRPSTRRRSTAPSRTGRRARARRPEAARARKPTGRPLTIATRPSPAASRASTRRRVGQRARVVGAFDDRRRAIRRSRRAARCGRDRSVNAATVASASITVGRYPHGREDRRPHARSTASASGSSRSAIGSTRIPS